LPLLPWPRGYAVRANLANRLEAPNQRGKCYIVRGMLPDMRKRSELAALWNDSDVFEKLAPALIFISIARVPEIIVVRQQPSLSSIETNRMRQQPIPKRVAGTIRRIITLQPTYPIDLADPDNQPVDRFVQGMPALGVKKD